jgi:hypothetical protein
MLQRIIVGTLRRRTRQQNTAGTLLAASKASSNPSVNINMNTNTNTDPTVKSKRPDSCCFVLFGVTGDLAHRLVIPALYNLAEANLLPERFCVIGVARSEIPTQTLHNDLMAALNQYATRPVNQSIANKLFECITSISADPSEPHSFERLKTELDGVCERDIRNHLYYLAVPPAAFKPISEALASVGLLRESKGGWRRLVVEKPFGTDLASASALNRDLLNLVNEHQIYRIDHYLGKETVGQKFAGSQRRLLRADPSQAPGEAARCITVRCRAVGSRTGRAHGLAISRYHRGARNGSVGGRRFAGGGRAVRAARVADLALSVAHARNGILGRRRRKEGHYRACIQRGGSAGSARIRVGRRNNLDAGPGCRASECPVHGDRS